MEYSLASVLSIVYHNSVSFFEFFLFSYLGGSDEESSEDLLVFFLSCREASKSVSLPGNDDDVNWGCRGNVAEGEDFLVFIHYIDR